jgi:hypothetical protein
MSFIQQVEQKFSKARESKDLILFDSTVVEKDSGGLKVTSLL